MSDDFVDTIASALFGKTRRAILALLFSNTDREYYVREIMRFVKSGKGAVERELKNLESAGIIKKEQKGHLVYFKANKKSPVFEELRGLTIKTVGVADILKNALKPLEAKIKLCFIYGSIASGDEDHLSDIDLMIVGDVGMRDIFGVLYTAIDKLRRVVNPHTISIREFKKRLRDKQDFIHRIWSGNKIMLFGDEDEFA